MKKFIVLAFTLAIFVTVPMTLEAMSSSAYGISVGTSQATSVVRNVYAFTSHSTATGKAEIILNEDGTPYMAIKNGQKCRVYTSTRNGYDYMFEAGSLTWYFNL